MKQFKKFAYPATFYYWERKVWRGYRWERNPPNRKERKRIKMRDRVQYFKCKTEVGREFMIELMRYTVVLFPPIR